MYITFRNINFILSALIAIDFIVIYKDKCIIHEDEMILKIYIIVYLYLESL